YQPGDAETIVTLGCTDLPSINNSTCSGGNDLQIMATVGDFENLPFSVSPTVADRLSVTVGEPTPIDDGITTGHNLLSAGIAKLDRIAIGPTPTWGGSIGLTFQSSTCLQALEL